ncbi:MAG: radical SAM protein [Pseudomonadota bacterium]|nr:radical SAM protein [Pseudomonadota bacterium]
MNVNLELTDHCNIRCRMCSQSMRDDAHGGPKKFMSFDTWRRSLQGLRGMGEVALCPHWLGEPTLHPRFDAFVEYAFAVNRSNELFRTFKVHTNAVILSPERAARLVRLAASPGQAPDTFTAIHFSIDAFHPATYAVVKGADKHALVYKNVERFLTIRKELGAERPVAHLAIVVQDENWREVGAFVKHWGGLLDRLGRRWNLTADWPPFDADAIYLRRLNSGDQARSDALHASACRGVGIVAPTTRPDGSF